MLNYTAIVEWLLQNFGKELHDSHIKKSDVRKRD